MTVVVELYEGNVEDVKLYETDDRSEAMELRVPSASVEAIDVTQEGDDLILRDGTILQFFTDVEVE